MLSLVDRKSRFTLAAELPDMTAESVHDAMVTPLSQLPPDRLKSITPSLLLHRLTGPSPPQMPWLALSL